MTAPPLIVPPRRLWAPRPARPLCPRCRLPLRQRYAPRWRDRLRAPLRIAAGDVLLDAAGNRVLSDAGDVQLSDGAGDECCCGCPTATDDANCPDRPPRTWTVTFAGMTACAGCVHLSNGGGRNAFIQAAGLDGTGCLDYHGDGGNFGSSLWSDLSGPGAGNPFASVCWLDMDFGVAAGCPGPHTITRQYFTTSLEIHPTAYLLRVSQVGIAVVLFYGTIARAAGDDCYPAGPLNFTNALVGPCGSVESTPLFPVGYATLATGGGAVATACCTL